MTVTGAYHTTPIAGTGMSVSGGSERSQVQSAMKGITAATLWEDGDYLYNVSTRLQMEVGGGYGAGAKIHIVPIAQFIRNIERGE